MLKRGAMLLFLSSCLLDSPDIWRGEETFTPEERADIETGAAMMYRRHGRALPVFHWVSADRANILRQSIPGEPLGTCDRREIRIVLDFDVVEPRHRVAVAAHEFGHCAFGLKHTDGGIMNERVE